MGINIPVQDILQSMITLARQGKVPAEQPPGHHDGWGIVIVPDFDWKKARLIRNNRSIIDDVMFENLDLWNISKFSGQIFCHLRKASKGDKSIHNTHPFSFPGFFFMHNGTIDFTQNIFRSFKQSHPNFEPVNNLSGNYTDSVIYGEILHFFWKKLKDIGKAWKETIDWINNAKIEYTSTTSAVLMPYSLGFLRNFSQDQDCYKLYYSKNSEYMVFSQEKILSLEWKEVLPLEGIIFKQKPINLLENSNLDNISFQIEKFKL